MAIIHRYGATVEDLDKTIPTVDPAGFDTATRSILFRGDYDQLLSTFYLGASLSGSPKMYCTGPQGGSRSRFGHIWATIGYKGFLDGGNGRKQVSAWSVTTRETELPITYTKANGAPYTTWAGSPFTPGEINGKTGTYYRCRVIEPVYGVVLQGVTIGNPTSGPDIPTDPGVDIPTNVRKIDWSKLFDPCYNYPSDWVLRDHQVTSQFVAGDAALFFWTARFEWVYRLGP